MKEEISMMPKQEQVAKWREEYPPGTRIELIHMDDPYNPIPAGTKGTVEMVDDGGNVHMKWDDGQTLSLCPEVDKFRKI